MGTPFVATVLLLIGPLGSAAMAQSAENDSRQALVEQAQAAKAATLHPYVPGGFERVLTRVENSLVNRTVKWHPYFENGYKGGGFAPGIGYTHHVSPYSTVD